VNKFGSKKGAEEEGCLSQAFICPEGSLQMGMLFGMRPTHASDFGVGMEVTQLFVRF